MSSLTGTIGNTRNTSMLPKRIISLVPSQTELLYHLGLENEVAGITKFCVHPDTWFRSKTRIGGTKTVKIDAVKALQPDLILANKEENVKEQVEELSTIAPVYTSDISTSEDALIMIKEIGKLTGKEEKAKELVEKIELGFEELEIFIRDYSMFDVQPKTAYLIWKDPYIAAGGDTFISNMMEKCGFKNIFKHINRYPEITVESSVISSKSQTTNHQLQTQNCQLLLLSSEPYPFKQKHVDELQQELPYTKILLVDGEMFSWYGSRMLNAASYFRRLIIELSNKE